MGFLEDLRFPTLWFRLRWTKSPDGRQEVVLEFSWCAGHEDLLGPLARLCPESCGCANVNGSQATCVVGLENGNGCR